MIKGRSNMSIGQAEIVYQELRKLIIGQYLWISVFNHRSHAYQV